MLTCFIIESTKENTQVIRLHSPYNKVPETS